MKRLLYTIWICCIMVLCCGCDNGQIQAPRRYMDTAMGTVISQSIYCPGEEGARNFTNRSMALLRELEQEMLSRRLETSELFRINASAGSQEGCQISLELFRLLQECTELSQASEGAFEITLGELVELWNIDQWAVGEPEQEKPAFSQEEILRVRDLCGYYRMKLESKEEYRIFLPEGMSLDLGAVGKGYALDRMRTILEEEEEITGAILSVGGNVLTYGRKPDGSSWKVGIVNPFEISSNIGVLSLEGQWCVSTSGDYERYVEVEGVRYHHILDPATGYPARSGVRSVTILSENGMQGDALSTACFILGPEKGMALAATYGVQALFILEDGQLVLSEGMERYWSESVQ